MSPDFEVLFHALGLDERHDEPYRNRFVACPGHHDLPKIARLVEGGWMARVRTPGFCDPEDMVYMATPAGKERAITENLARRPKLTRAQLRYRKWLDISDVVDISFGDFLRGGCCVS